MDVNNIEVRVPRIQGGTICFAPVLFEIALDVQVEGQARRPVPLTNQWSGFVVPVDGHTLLRKLTTGDGYIVPCDLELSWSPAENLSLSKEGPFSFSNLNDLLTAEQPGVVEIVIAVVQREQLAASGQIKTRDSANVRERIWPKELFLTHLADQSSFMLGDRSAFLKVGQNVTPLVGVSNRERLEFDPREAVSGRLDLLNVSEQECTLDEITQHLENNKGPRPLRINYKWSEEIGAGSAARFERPRPFENHDEDAVWVKRAEFTLVHGRSPGQLNLIFSGEATDDRYKFPPMQTLGVKYQVEPVKLTMTLKPAPGDDFRGALLFEDNFVELEDEPNGGRLVSSFRLEVERENRVLYRSWEDATLEMEMPSPDVLLVKSIYKEDANGERVQMPFQIECKSSDPSVVEFWQPAGEAGEYFVRRNLDQIVSAISYQNPCEISVRLLGLEPTPVELDVYQMPEPEKLAVLIPPPLEAHLTLWEDNYFSGPLAQSLESPGQVLEVIYASGRVSGSVKNRRGTRSEEITLQLRPGNSSPEDLSLQFFTDGPNQGDENFTSEVDRLTEGTNVLELSAIKPIQRAMGLRPSRASATLNGVRPRAVSLEPPSSLGHTVLRRDVGSFTFEYSRAESAQLQEITDSGTTPLYTYGESYDSTGDTVPVTLKRETGDHTLVFVAFNDFGHRDSNEFTMNAPPPTLTVECLTGASPHEPGDRLHVGNSVRDVDVDVRLQFCLECSIWRNSVPANPLRPSDPFNIFLDILNFSLNVGRNSFLFEAGNEFATETSDFVVRRRDAVFDVEGRLSMSTYDSNQEALIEIDRIRPVGWINMADGTRTSGFDHQFEFQDLPDPLGLESIKWMVIDRNTNNREAPATWHSRIFFRASSIGPDFEELVSFMEISPTRVDTDDPDSDRFPISILSDREGLDEDDPDRYWEQARLTRDDDSHTILIHTRALGG